MLYHSTRSKNLTADSAAAVLQGLAPDGGLYVPVVGASLRDARGRLGEASLRDDILLRCHPERSRQAESKDL